MKVSAREIPRSVRWTVCFFRLTDLLPISQPRRHSPIPFHSIWIVKDLFSSTGVSFYGPPSQHCIHTEVHLHKRRNGRQWRHDSVVEGHEFSYGDRTGCWWLLWTVLDQKVSPGGVQSSVVSSSAGMQNSLTWAPSYPCCIANLLLLFGGLLRDKLTCAV